MPQDKKKKQAKKQARKKGFDFEKSAMATVGAVGLKRPKGRKESHGDQKLKNRPARTRARNSLDRAQTKTAERRRTIKRESAYAKALVKYRKENDALEGSKRKRTSSGVVRPKPPLKGRKGSRRGR